MQQVGSAGFTGDQHQTFRGIQPSPERAPASRSASPGTSSLAQQESTIRKDLLTCTFLRDLSVFELGYASALKYTPDLDGSKGQHV